MGDDCAFQAQQRGCHSHGLWATSAERVQGIIFLVFQETYWAAGKKSAWFGRVLSAPLISAAICAAMKAITGAARVVDGTGGGSWVD